MIHNIAYIPILGYPLFMFLGFLAFLLLLAAATVGHLVLKGTKNIPFNWHPILVSIALTIAVAHIILGLSVFFNF